MVSVSASVKQREPEQRTLPGAPQSAVLFDKKSEKVTTPMLTEQTSVAKKNRKAPAREDAQMVHATLKFPPLGEEWYMPWHEVNFYNETEDYSFEIYPYDEEYNYSLIEEWEIEIPAGTYDVLSKFEKFDSENLMRSSHLVYYIIEEINISEGTVIELKPAESTVCLTMETTNPDGEKTRFRKIRYLNENYDWEIIEEGNVADVYLKQLIIWNGNVVESLSSNAGGIVLEPGPCGYFDGQENCNFYVNPVSDKYIFRSLRCMPAWPNEDNGIYMAVTQCRGAIEGTYANNGTYNLDDSSIAPTPAFEKYPPVDSDYDVATPYSMNYFPVYEDGSQSWFGKSIYSTVPYCWKIWSSGPSNVYNEKELYMTYSKSLNDAYIPVETEWGTWIGTYKTNAPKVYPYAQEGITMTVNPYGTLSVYENGESDPINLYPGNPAYAALCESQKMETGASAPLLTFYALPQFNWDTEEMVNLYQYFYTGRVGEMLGATADLSDITLAYNGNMVAGNSDEAYDWILSNQGSNGEYSFKVTTDNFAVNGISGGNRAYITYNTNGDDSTPPSVTMLQLRDSNGNISQVFDTAASGEILLSAADFTVNMGEPDEWGDRPVWFDLAAPAKVSAWCAPNGLDTEVICEIDLEEDAEAGIAHGFGALYRGSLSTVDLTSPNGWYDLTISVEDAGGNRQVQTLSPAFKIDTLTGISSVATDASVRVNGNEIIAPAGSRIYNLGGAEVGCKALPKGVYLVVTAEKTVKVAVR